MPIQEVCPTGRLSLAGEHRAPGTVLRGPREVIVVNHGERGGRRRRRLAGSGRNGDGVERDGRLGIVWDPRQELRRRPDVVDRGTEEAVASAIEAAEPLPLHL